MPQNEAHIKELRELIEHHNSLYYTKDEQEISDEEFDKLLAELEKLEENFPQMTTQDSPTRRVGGEPAQGFKTAEHKTPMKSLGNTYSYEELGDFQKRVTEALGVSECSFSAELKIDGVAVSLHYENGNFIQGITRGNGEVGDDITANLKTIRSIPIRIENAPKNLEVRGEVYMNRQGFEKLNQKRLDNNENLFANPRNATAGSLKLLDSKIADKRPLKFFAYMGICEDIQTHIEMMSKINSWGFETVPHSLCSGMPEIINFCDKYNQERERLDYEIDGIVVKVNSLEQQIELGSTSKSPRWAIAYKYPARQAYTVIKDVIFQVGRTGTITPVAILKPAQLSGSVIKRATLHNEDEVRKKDIRIGDTAVIEKGGEIIPKVVKVLKEKRVGDPPPVKFPDKCPVCEGDVVRLPDEAALRCQNLSCPAQLKCLIGHYVSKNAMDIDGMGPALIEQLVDLKLIHNVADLYKLSEEQITDLERMGEKSALNVIEGIRKSKEQSLSRLIFGLGIRHVGVVAADTLAKTFASLEKLNEALAPLAKAQEKLNEALAPLAKTADTLTKPFGSLKKIQEAAELASIVKADETEQEELDPLAEAQEKLEKIDEIGPIMAKSILSFFSNEKNIATIKELRDAGVNMTEQSRVFDNQHPFFQKRLVFTGTMSVMPRNKAQEEVKKLGGKVSSSLTKTTDFLVCGENPGSKAEKAKKQKVTIISEEEFITKLTQQSTSV